MLRSSKRQRAGHAAASELGSSDDDLRQMNPSLMTERQQLAFLLRKTAPDAPARASDSSTESSNDDEDDASDSGELQESSASDARRIQRRPVTDMSAQQQQRRSTGTTGSGSSRRRTSGSNASVASESAGNHRARQRAHKSTNQQQQQRQHSQKGRHGSAVAEQTTSTSAQENRAVRANESEERVASALPPAKKLRVGPKEAERARVTEPHSEKRSSPSSSSDVLYLDTFDSDGSACSGDFWSLHCALCCADRSWSSHDALPDALFLCASCDRKYPTQRALGRV